MSLVSPLSTIRHADRTTHGEPRSRRLGCRPRWHTEAVSPGRPGEGRAAAPRAGEGEGCAVDESRSGHRWWCSWLWCWRSGRRPASADPISESQGFRKAVTVAGDPRAPAGAPADRRRQRRDPGGRHAGLRRLRGLHRRAGPQAAGYEVSLDEFTYVETFTEGSPPVLEETAPEPQVFVAGIATGVRRRLRVVHRKRRRDRPCPGGRSGASAQPGAERFDQRLRGGGLRRLRRRATSP